MMINLEYELIDNLRNFDSFNLERRVFRSKFAALKNSEDFDEGSGGGCVA